VEDLQLADLFDVELQLLRDRETSAEELRRRDRRIGQSIGADRRAGERRGLLRDWVREVQKGQESTGERILRAFHALGWLLSLFGLSTGMGTAAAVLAYDGRRPVNVVHFLAVFVGVQLGLLLLFVFSTVLWRLRGRMPGASGVYGLLRQLLDALIRIFERRMSAERRSVLAAARGRLRASTMVYGELERWLLVSLAQRFGLWFNLGALATCLYLVAFSDLAFAWQTTLDWSAEGFNRAIDILGAPWAWLYPDGVPSLEVVRATRYFRLDESFGAPARVELYGQWWRFLVLSLVVYGLLPRASLSVYARVKLRRALAGLRLDHGEIASLLERLISPLVSTRAPVAEDEGAAPPEAGVAGSVPSSGQEAAVIVWGGAPLDENAVEPLVAGRFGWRVRSTHAAGADDTRHDAEVISAVAGDGAEAPILVVAEAFEAPTREARAFLSRLREATGKQRPVVVGLVDAGAAPPARDDLAMWRRQLAGLGDPYLRVEALVES